MSRKILIVLTSHGDLAGIRSTGFYVNEAAEPWAVFTQAGYVVEFASVAGGEPPRDGYDPDQAIQRRFFETVDLSRLPAVVEVNPDRYDAVFFAGGHGTMWDFRSREVGRVAAAVFETGGVVAAVCHGPAALVDAELTDGTALVRGRRVTGFSNAEENAVGLSTAVPFLLQDELSAAGGEFTHAAQFAEHVISDGNLITGQNPASARSCAHAVIDALSAPRSPRPATRVWFITGAGAGLGQAIARQALDRGDHVIATARDETQLAAGLPAAADRLVTCHLDVTDVTTIRDAVTTGLNHFGGIDILVNNAGYGLRGATEEWDTVELRHQFDTNVFGAIDVTRAVLPVMRQQGSGRIIQMSSVGGVSATLGGTAYAGTKFALEGLSEGLAQEVAHLGIQVTLVEPGPFRTEFAGRSTRWSGRLPTYREPLTEPYRRFREQDGSQPNDPARAAQIIVELTRRDTMPLRLPLGPESFDRIRQVYQTRLSELTDVEGLGRDTAFS